MTNDTPNTPPDDNHVSTVRRMLIEQMRDLRSAKPDALQNEMSRARAIAATAKAVTELAKVEADYAIAGAAPVAFLEPAANAPRLTRTGNSTTHRLLG